MPKLPLRRFRRKCILKKCEKWGKVTFVLGRVASMRQNSVIILPHLAGRRTQATWVYIFRQSLFFRIRGHGAFWLPLQFFFSFHCFSLLFFQTLFLLTMWY